MKELVTAVPTPHGQMETFICHPSEGGPHGGVVLYMDIWGLREELFDIARGVAMVGYCCMVPDFYYRQGRIRNEYRSAKGQMITLAKLPEEQREAVRAPGRKVRDGDVVEDTRDLLTSVLQDGLAHDGLMGAIGYCMGGRHAFRVAAAMPDRFRVSASLHGTSLVTEADDSPHRLAPQMAGEVYCGLAERDEHASRTITNALDQSFRAAPAIFRRIIHKDAEHGYALPDRDIFDKHATNRDFEIIFAMLHRQVHRGRSGRN